jgi:regulator of CtrA degradation
MQGQAMTEGDTPELPEEGGQIYADWAKLMDVYNEGLGLVEEAADYLANEGEAEKDKMPPLALTAFMSESMRLTTRLTTMMSWLMLQRAVADAEITADDARKPEHRLRRQPRGVELDSISRSMLPERLTDLVDRSTTLYRRVERLEKQFFAGAPDNPVQSMIDRIESEMKKP